MRVGEGAPSLQEHLADDNDSGPLRKRQKHHTRATNVGTSQPSFPLQFAIQLSGCRVLVCGHRDAIFRLRS